MKTKKYALLAGLALTLAACNNVSDMLEPSDGIMVSTLATRDTMSVTPTDTVRFKFIVSTNQGEIRNIDLDIDTTLVEKLPEKTTFGLVDNDNELTLDAEGNLSRPISTVVVEYPVVVKTNPAVLAGAHKVVLRATNAAGKKAYNYTFFKGSNIRKNSTVLKFMDGWSLNAKTKMFFDPFNFRAYSSEEFIGNDKVSESRADSIMNSIAMIIGYRYDATNLLGTYRMFSPDSEQAEQFMQKEVRVAGYDRTKMKRCLFFRLEGVGGSELDEQIANETDNSKKNQLMTTRNNMDKEFFDQHVDNDYLNNLDFSNATDYLVIKGGLYAFMTHDGRKGIFWINYMNVFSNPIPISIQRYAFQVLSTEK